MRKLGPKSTGTPNRDKLILSALWSLWSYIHAHTHTNVQSICWGQVPLPYSKLLFSANLITRTVPRLLQLATCVLTTDLVVWELFVCISLLYECPYIHTRNGANRQNNSDCLWTLVTKLQSNTLVNPLVHKHTHTHAHVDTHNSPFSCANSTAASYTYIREPWLVSICLS